MWHGYVHHTKVQLLWQPYTVMLSEASQKGPGRFIYVQGDPHMVLGHGWLYK